MRKYIIGLLVIAVGLVIGSAASAYDPPAPAPGSGINGTVHDLGTAHNGMDYTADPADSLNRICIFCHTPHHAYKILGTGIGTGPEAPAGYDYLPLWNHVPSGNWGSYIPYTNGPGAPQVGPKASQAILNGLDQPGGNSMLCLSCHDGSIAVNSYGNSDQPGTSQSGSVAGGVEKFINPAYMIGKDNYLGNHHPIGFSYDAVFAQDNEIRDPDTTAITATSSIRDHLYGDGSTQMECGTCHSVHNTGNTGEALLWRSDFESQFCLTCHAKGFYTDPPQPEIP